MASVLEMMSREEVSKRLTLEFAEVKSKTLAPGRPPISARNESWGSKTIKWRFS